MRDVYTEMKNTGSIFILANNTATTNALPEGLVVENDLCMFDGSIEALPKGLVVRRNLYVHNGTIGYIHDGLVVGHDMTVIRSSIGPLPKGLVVGHNLTVSRSSINALPAGLVVGGNLDISGCAYITSLPEGLVVGGDLIINGSGITSLPKGLVIGRNLGAGSNITHLPEDTLVGGTAYLQGGEFERNDNVEPITWNNGKYMLVDGILTEIVKRRGRVYHTKEVADDVVGYVVTDGDVWAHGSTLPKAKADLMYKKAVRDTSVYRGMPLNAPLPVAEAAAMYRAITGACAEGVRLFMRTLPEVKDVCTLHDVINITKTRGAYGNTLFAAFFQTN